MLDALLSPRPLPTFFGDPARPLFGWYHPAETRPRRVGVVLCNALGHEQIRVARAYRYWAERLAERGFPVLRFDYDGTGESHGTDGDPGRLDAWRASVGRAVDELSARTGVTEICLAGARMGATLALLCAADRPDVRHLLLWSPCLTGDAYLREQRFMSRMAFASPAGSHVHAPGGDEDFAGFLMTGDTCAALRGIDIRGLRAAPAHDALLLGNDRAPLEEPLAKHLAKLGVTTRYLRFPGRPCWTEDARTSFVPREPIDAAVAWLCDIDDHAPAIGAAVRTSSPRGARSGPANGAMPFRETPLWFGPHPGSFGILSTPTDMDMDMEANPRFGRVAVLLLNRFGGTGRAQVEMARRWTALGFSVFRFDPAGLGIRLLADDIYAETNAVSECLDFLWVSRGFDSFVLVGLCTGAQLAREVARDDARVTAIALVSPPVPALLDESGVADRVRYSRLTSRQRWVRFLRGDLDRRRVVETAGAYVRDGVQRIATRSTGRAAGCDVAWAPSATRPCRALLVYAKNDEAFRDLQRRRGEANGPLLIPGARVELLDGADHAFTPLWSQRWLDGILTEFLVASEGDLPA